MPLKQRIVRITITPRGQNTPVVLESIGGENFAARISINKAIDAFQQQAVIDIVGLTTTVRSYLLGAFSAYQTQLVADGAPANYCDITIEAGYISQSASGTTQWLSTLFVGQVVAAQMVEGPPDVRVVLQCYTRQVDKTQWTQALPNSATYRTICELVAKSLGVTLSGTTAFDGQTVTNFGVSVGTLSGLVIELQNITLGKTVAWVDNGALVVSDANKAINPTAISTFDSFIGIPSADPYGANFKVLLSDSLPSLGGAVTIQSATRNVQPGFTLSDTPTDVALVQGTYVAGIMQYEIATRETPFYCHVWGLLPA